MKENSINNNFTEENHKSRNLRNIKRISYYEDISVDDEIEDDYNQKEENLKSKSLRKRKRSPKKENSENESEINTNINKNEISKEKKNYSNLGTIINIKDLKVPLNNTQIILMLLEICLNSSNYGINLDNSSRLFWEKIAEKKNEFSVLEQFKPETLRKYWRRIRTTKKYKQIISDVKEYESKLNEQNMKLLSSINALCDFVLCPYKGIDYYIEKYTMKHPIKKKEVKDEDPIDEIANTLKLEFKEKSIEEIIQILYMVSGDIKKAYLVLKDKDKFGRLAFDEKDDNIILGNHKKEYNELARNKGNDNIIERKKFLLSLDDSNYEI
jgi:hypothetical protein